MLLLRLGGRRRLLLTRGGAHAHVPEGMLRGRGIGAVRGGDVGARHGVEAVDVLNALALDRDDRALARRRRLKCRPLSAGDARTI